MANPDTKLVTQLMVLVSRASLGEAHRESQSPGSSQPRLSPRDRPRARSVQRLGFPCWPRLPVPSHNEVRTCRPWVNSFRVKRFETSVWDRIPPGEFGAGPVSSLRRAVRASPAPLGFSPGRSALPGRLSLPSRLGPQREVFDQGRQPAGPPALLCSCWSPRKLSTPSCCLS